MTEITSVDDLLRKPFRLRTFAEKKRLVNSPAPQPILTIEQNQKLHRRHFNVSCYSKHSTWLGGCPVRNRLFCIPCLFFSSDPSSSVWTSAGYCDLNNLNKACTKHEKSQQHIRCVISQKSFGEVRIETQVSEHRRREMLQRNEEAKKNRDIMKRFIDITSLLAKQELPFRGHCENANSVNRGNYAEFAKFLCDYDLLFQKHLSEATVFSGLSNHIQNDLISSVSSVLKTEICKEINDCEMMSIELDETTDICAKSQLSVIFRFVKKSVCVERFFGFID